VEYTLQVLVGKHVIDLEVFEVDVLPRVGEIISVGEDNGRELIVHDYCVLTVNYRYVDYRPMCINILTEKLQNKVGH